MWAYPLFYAYPSIICQRRFISLTAGGGENVGLGKSIVIAEVAGAVKQDVGHVQPHWAGFGDLPRFVEQLIGGIGDFLPFAAPGTFYLLTH